MGLFKPVTYQEGLEMARARSVEYRCTVHLCAIIEKVNGEPKITSYRCSDWRDDSTVDTFTDGKRHD